MWVTAGWKSFSPTLLKGLAASFPFVTVNECRGLARSAKDLFFKWDSTATIKGFYYNNQRIILQQSNDSTAIIKGFFSNNQRILLQQLKDSSTAIKGSYYKNLRILLQQSKDSTTIITKDPTTTIKGFYCNN
ncbi:hypothetical protein TNIN_127331 [Trichonephila inaurata madagascariensis]|uniref:Uncharacterized protein n=1 Tax=Trichonephila inaurata madagascariensis TaxID=2747483 RepID=A0A8X6JE07_9ARAC|nr:hypothetical protein TNIN_127331 [Trichonephila inaurata madagascariensis]